MYFSKMYDRYIVEHSYNIYGYTLIRLPTPRYMVHWSSRLLSNLNCWMHLLVQRGNLKSLVAAKELRISIKELKRGMEKAGYRFQD